MHHKTNYPMMNYNQNQNPYYSSQIIHPQYFTQEIPNHNFLQTNFSNPYSQVIQSQMCEDSNFSQIIKSNLEHNLSKIPEKFFNAIMGKVNPKLEKNYQELTNLNYNIKKIEKKRLEKNKNERYVIDIIRKMIEELENKTQVLIVNQTNSNCLSESFGNLNSENNIFYRQLEENASRYLRDFDYMQSKILEIISIIRNDINSKLELQESYIDEIKDILVDKLNSAKIEIQNKKNKRILNLNNKINFSEILEILSNFENFVKNQKNSTKIYKNNNFSLMNNRSIEMDDINHKFSKIEENKINKKKLKEFCFFN